MGGGGDRKIFLPMLAVEEAVGAVCRQICQGYSYWGEICPHHAGGGGGGLCSSSFSTGWCACLLNQQGSQGQDKDQQSGQEENKEEESNQVCPDVMIKQSEKNLRNRILAKNPQKRIGSLQVKRAITLGLCLINTGIHDSEHDGCCPHPHHGLRHPSIQPLFN